MDIQKILFSDIGEKVDNVSGLYEIYTNGGVPLKVGIAFDLKKRLRQHKLSRQNALKQKNTGDVTEPSHLVSKSSILAKHLYFDRSITGEYDLTSEGGRQMFLAEQCFLIVEYTENKEIAREIERQRECSEKFRYVGRVVKH